MHICIYMLRNAACTATIAAPAATAARGPTCLRCELVRRRRQRRTGAMSVRCAMARRFEVCIAFADGEYASTHHGAESAEAQQLVRKRDAVAQAEGVRVCTKHRGT